jgi:hypothetical protein
LQEGELARERGWAHALREPVPSVPGLLPVYSELQDVRGELEVLRGNFNSVCREVRFLHDHCDDLRCKVGDLEVLTSSQKAELKALRRKLGEEKVGDH